MKNKLILLGKATLYTLALVTLLSLIISFSEGNEEFVTIFIFGLAILFTIIICTLIIIEYIKNKG
ncbi:hypothetical protein [Clostridium tertium]|uniref:hypothetical protein n=1 Tax=Clostridium tertium TaxID=1559 RepID=UPI000DCFFB83|nr:hypothetical protein [Clostridium tertium]